MDAPPPAKGRSKDIEREQPRLDTVQVEVFTWGILRHIRRAVYPPELIHRSVVFTL